MLSLAPGVAQAVIPTRIMPLGDSLTHGIATGAYRTQLEDLLMADRFDFNFVGSLASGPVDLEASRHEGHSGFRIDQIAASVDGWLTKYQPEFVLLLIGTNDVLQDHQLATAPDRLSALIDQIAARRPSAEILVGSIPPLADPALDAKGLAGYEVWRATGSGGPFVRIAVVPAGSTSYSDGAVVSGGTYWYYVVAFDGAGNRSASSNLVDSRPK